MTTGKLSERERIFLAGCMKSMILADGKIDIEEVDELDRLIDQIDFTDFEICLEKFEVHFRDSDAFWDEAKSMKDQAKETILTLLEDISLMEGFRQIAETKLLANLKEIWKSE
jgi:hypothetical protein